MKKAYVFLIATLLGLSIGCSKKEEAPSKPLFDANLTAVINGAQQVPANASPATGTFEGVFDSKSMTLTYTVEYRGMTPNIAHIHVGAPGTNGSVVIPFRDVSSPITGTYKLDKDGAEDLLYNGMYVNIHSTAFPGGEIRGDIKVK
jgi:hypothetical protein